MRNKIQIIQAANAAEEYERINAANSNIAGTTSLRSELYGNTTTTSSSKSSASSSSSKSSVTTRVSSSSKSSDEEDTDRTTGPGAIKAIVDETADSGPKLQEVRLSETYHEDYGVYEQSFEDVYFIYTTVSNGGITDKSVALDIPAGLSYTLEKDGVSVPYVSGQPLGDRGTYVFRFTGVDDKELPFSEQTVYKAVFRFRIQERLPQTETGGDSGSSYLPESARGLWEAVDGYPVTPAEETISWEDIPGTEELAEGETEAESMEAETEGELFGNPAFIMEDGTYDEEAMDAVLDQVIGAGVTDTQSQLGYNPGNGLFQEYDAASGYYKQTLLTGSSFYTNVPNGMLQNGSVTLQSGEGQVGLTVYKDGELLEYTAGQELTEPGSYLVLAQEATTLFISGYSQTTKPVFAFRILSEAVNDLGVVHAPEGMKIEQVLLEGSSVPESIHAEGRYAKLLKDGNYTIWFSGEQGEISTGFLLDRVSPRFYLRGGKNKMEIVWTSNDVVRCELSKNGKVQSVDGIIYEVTGSGTYGLTAYDAAGNTGTTQFKVTYSMNMAAVAGIILTAGLVIAGVLFARSVNERMKVR